MPIKIEPTEPTKEPDSLSGKASSKGKPTDLGASSLEASQLVATLLVPLVHSPLLTPPKEANSVDRLSSIMTQSISRTDAILYGVRQQLNDTMLEIMQEWNENRRELNEELKRIINSPKYQDMEAIKKGKIKENFSVSSTASNDHLLTLTLLFSVGRGVALGSQNGAIAVIDKLLVTVHPMVPELTKETFEQVVNLSPMLTTFYLFLGIALNNIDNKVIQDQKAMILSFAKEVIKMVEDPLFSLSLVINHSEKISQLSPQQKHQLVMTMKLILASLALGLVVGQSRDQLVGKEIKLLPVSDKTEQYEIARQLILQIHSLLEDVSKDIRGPFLVSLFEFLGDSQKLEQLLDSPIKFSQECKQVIEGKKNVRIDHLYG